MGTFCRRYGYNLIVGDTGIIELSEKRVYFVGGTGITQLSEEWVVGDVYLSEKWDEHQPEITLSEVWVLHQVRRKLSEVRIVGEKGCRRSEVDPFGSLLPILRSIVTKIMVYENVQCGQTD
jgi:hypothetical protein